MSINQTLPVGIVDRIISLIVHLLTYTIRFIPKYRRILNINFRIAFGPQDRPSISKVLSRFADNITMCIRFVRGTAPHIQFLSRDLIAEISSSTPWIAVTGHFGPFELVPSLSRTIGVPFSIVFRPTNNIIVQKFLQKMRPVEGVKYIQKRDVYRSSVKAMEENESVGIVGDHNAGFQGQFVPFLGYEASTSKLPAMLAVRFQKPILMIFVRMNNGNPVAWVEQIIYPREVTSDTRKEEIHRLLLEMNNTFSDVIRRYPEEWFWLHQRWKTRPGDKEAGLLR